MSTEVIYEFNFTNTCTCNSYDIENDTVIPLDYCDGSCWDDVLEDFTNITEHLFDKNETMWWKVNNLTLWNGNHSGYIYAKTVEQLIRGMSVNSEWTMHGQIYGEYILYSLHHHDAPMGSNTVLRIISEEQKIDLGLY